MHKVNLGVISKLLGKTNISEYVVIIIALVRVQKHGRFQNSGYGGSPKCINSHAALFTNIGACELNLAL